MQIIMKKRDNYHIFKYLAVLKLTLPIFLFVLLSFSFNVNAQIVPCDAGSVWDELGSALEVAKTDPKKSLGIINQIIAKVEKEKNPACIHKGYMALAKYHFLNNQLDESLLSANQAYLIANELGLETPMQETLIILSEIHIAKDIKVESLEYLYKGLEYSEQLKDTISISWFLLQIPEIEQEIGNIGQAMEYALKAKAFFESTTNTKGLSSTLINIGEIHVKLGNLALAKENLYKAHQTIISHNDTLLLAKAKLAFCNLLIAESKIDEARDFCIDAINLLTNSDLKGLHRAQSKLGEIEAIKKDFGAAEELLKSTLNKQIEARDNTGQSYTLLRLAKLYKIRGEINHAIETYKKSIDKSDVIGLNDLTRSAYKDLAQIFGGEEEFKEAFSNLNQYTRLTDSLFNIQKISEAAKLEENYKLDQQLKEIQWKDIEISYRDEKLSKQKNFQVILYFGMLIFLGLSIFAFRESYQKKKAIATLANQKKELEEQKFIADKRTHDFTDSLNYAKRIQQAILRASLKFNEIFTESFIVLFPRNIVSGDFFWLKERKSNVLFALADCTGHGVPGALMSIIGTFGLNRFADEMGMSNPSEILENLNVLFEESFKQKKGVEIFDGMDIALCSYNPTSKELIYAGANIPLYILRESGLPQPTRTIAAKGESHTLYVVKPNKQPIGSFFEKKPFVNHSIVLKENDTIYLFTDGFYDQFGGPDGRKYKSGQIYGLLCNLGNMSLEMQKSILEETFTEWKGSRNQIDDVSFMGIKI